MTIYTAFCRHTDGQGTTWIAPVEADTIERAQEAARVDCAGDWECEPADVECIGLAAGNVEIAYWGDDA